jgi:hypothetical protein
LSYGNRYLDLEPLAHTEYAAPAFYLDNPSSKLNHPNPDIAMRFAEKRAEKINLSAEKKTALSEVLQLQQRLLGELRAANLSAGKLFPENSPNFLLEVFRFAFSVNSPLILR